jgi:hypothetical protein
LKLAYPAKTKEQKEKYYYFFALESVVPGFKTEIERFEDGFRVRLALYECEILGKHVNDELRVEAITSIGGPGWHAWLVDMLDGLGVKPIKVEDPTGYYAHRDFSRLQDTMDEWLRDMSIKAVNQNKGIRVSCNPLGVPEESNHFAFCPLGSFEKEFFQRAAWGVSIGMEYFIWWNNEPDALYYFQIAINLIWWHVIWIKPVSEREEEILSSALMCLEKAYEMDNQADGGQNGLEFPVEEWLEIARLAGDAETEMLLHKRFGQIGKGTLGYMRGNIVSRIGNWLYPHRGSMHISYVGDGEHIWTSDDVKIIVQTGHVKLSEDMINKPREALQEVIGEDSGYKIHVSRSGKLQAFAYKSCIVEMNELPCACINILYLNLNDVLSYELRSPDPNNNELIKKYLTSIVYKPLIYAI